MEKALTLYDTTIGKKAVMAITGLILFGFVIGHMLGNLQIYVGEEQLNSYAEKLQALGPLLVVVRVVLGTTFLVHIHAALSLSAHSRAARQVGYRKTQTLATTYAARTMMWSGPILLLFVGYHLVHFTLPSLALSMPGLFGEYTPEAGQVYRNVVSGFGVPGVAILYIIAQIALGMHLFHGGWSLFQTVGFSHPRHGNGPRNLARWVAIIVTLGNISIPVSVLAGRITL